MIRAGNDLVDLRAVSGPPRSENRRFLRRVLTREEQEFVAKSASPERMLWSLWSGKEAAFKAFSRTDPGLAFSPVSFACTVQSTDPENWAMTGSVSMGGHKLNLFWEQHPDWIHCTALPAAISPADCHYQVEPVSSVTVRPGDFSRREQEEIWSEASLAVRQVARNIIRRSPGLSVAIIRPEGERINSRRGAPRVMYEGREDSSFTVSLSHDGARVAALVCHDSGTWNGGQNAGETECRGTSQQTDWL